jgi:cell division protein FtsB
MIKQFTAEIAQVAEKNERQRAQIERLKRENERLEQRNSELSGKQLSKAG